MRVTREQAAANRQKIVHVASTLFRQHGFDGIGVADIMKGAGLTHGGFYGHFASKDDLATEACTRALGGDDWAERVAGRPDPSLGAVVRGYCRRAIATIRRTAVCSRRFDPMSCVSRAPFGGPSPNPSGSELTRC